VVVVVQQAERRRPAPWSLATLREELLDGGLSRARLRARGLHRHPGERQRNDAEKDGKPPENRM
jgi:hypothetical protein